MCPFSFFWGGGECIALCVRGKDTQALMAGVMLAKSTVAVAVVAVVEVRDLFKQLVVLSSTICCIACTRTACT